MEFVSALRTLLRERVGAGRYELWFGESTHMTCAGHVLCVSAPNQFILDWLQRNFKTDLQSCVREIAARHKSNQPAGLEFQLDDPGAGPATSSNQQSPSPALDDGPLDDGSQKRAAGRKADQPSGDEQLRLSELLSEPISSIPLPGMMNAEPPQRKSRRNTQPGNANSSQAAVEQREKRRFASLQEYVVGASNQTAVKAAELVLQQPGALSPFFVHGPSSVGKTHLLQGVIA